MRISFDLDGVIAEADRWFFTMLNAFGEVEAYSAEFNNTLLTMELNYYMSRPLKNRPSLFMAHNDEGFIITSRKPKAKEITENWLYKYGIDLPLVFSDHQDLIDWTDYKAGSIWAGTYKAKVIKELGINVHFDNNPYIVDTIRTLLPDTRVILVGGEQGL